MKKITPYPMILLALVLLVSSANAQRALVANQNPGYEESRNKYMSLADSMTSWHSTTSQETYTAIDYMETLRAERARRREFRRQVHLAHLRAFGLSNDYGYYPANSYYPVYNDNSYNNYDYNSSYYRPYYRNVPFWLPFTLGLNFHVH